MTREVYCLKLKKISPGMNQPPYNDALGEKIYNNISQEAWNMWLERQTIIINEYRLVCFEPQAIAFIMQEMDKFLFEDNCDSPATAN